MGKHVDALPEEVLNDLDPNIINTVLLLRDNGYETCDSGDGHYKLVNDIDPDALPYPHVFIMSTLDTFVEECDSLVHLLMGCGITFGPGSNAFIQVSYSPFDRNVFIEVLNITDDMLM